MGHHIVRNNSNWTYCGKIYWCDGIWDANDMWNDSWIACHPTDLRMDELYNKRQIPWGIPCDTPRSPHNGIPPKGRSVETHTRPPNDDRLTMRILTGWPIRPTITTYATHGSCRDSSHKVQLLPLAIPWPIPWPILWNYPWNVHVVVFTHFISFYSTWGCIGQCDDATSYETHHKSSDSMKPIRFNVPSRIQWGDPLIGQTPIIPDIGWKGPGTPLFV